MTPTPILSDALAFDPDRRQAWRIVGVVVQLPLVHFDEVVDGENRQRDPDRRRRGRPDFEHREGDDPGGKDDLQVEVVVGRELDLAVDLWTKSTTARAEWEWLARNSASASMLPVSLSSSVSAPCIAPNPPLAAPWAA